MTTRACEQGTVRDDAPVANDFGLVVRIIGGVVVVGPLTVDQGAPNIDANSWPVHQVGPLPAGANVIGFVGIDPAANFISTVQLPAALVGGRLDTNIGGWFGATTPTVGQKTMAASIPVVIASDQVALPVTVAASSGTLNNGAQTIVGAAAISILAANANRKKLVVQNVGATTIAVGAAGVTAVTGIILVGGGSMVFDGPNCPTNEIFAIRTTGVSSIAFTTEVV